MSVCLGARARFCVSNVCAMHCSECKRECTLYRQQKGAHTHCMQQGGGWWVYYTVPLTDNRKVHTPTVYSRVVGGGCITLYHLQTTEGCTHPLYAAGWWVVGGGCITLYHLQTVERCTHPLYAAGWWVVGVSHCTTYRQLKGAHTHCIQQGGGCITLYHLQTTERCTHPLYTAGWWVVGV